MGFQTSIRSDMATAFPGDIVLSGAIRAQTGVLATTTAANNVIGRALTHTAATDGSFEVGGTGAFAGILSGRHQYALATAGLAASTTLANGTIVEAVKFTSGIAVTLATTGAIGDGVAYAADGTLSAAPGGVAPASTTLIPGAQIVRYNITTAGLAVISLSDPVALPAQTLLTIGTVDSGETPSAEITEDYELNITFPTVA